MAVCIQRGSYIERLAPGVVQNRGGQALSVVVVCGGAAGGAAEVGGGGDW